VGTIPYDEEMVKAQLEGKSAVEYIEGDIRDRIEHIWEQIWTTM
jgi:CO dehydrogenase nickel-insertion accessory protein CooC1